MNVLMYVVHALEWCLCTCAHIPFAYSIPCTKFATIKGLNSTERVWSIKAEKFHTLQIHQTTVCETES